MESSQVKNILSKYLTVEKNVDIFSKHIARVDDEDLLDDEDSLDDTHSRSVLDEL